MPGVPAVFGWRFADAESFSALYPHFMRTSAHAFLSDAFQARLSCGIDAKLGECALTLLDETVVQHHSMPGVLRSLVLAYARERHSDHLASMLWVHQLVSSSLQVYDRDGFYIGVAVGHRGWSATVAHVRDLQLACRGIARILTMSTVADDESADLQSPRFFFACTLRAPRLPSPVSNGWCGLKYKRDTERRLGMDEMGELVEQRAAPGSTLAPAPRIFDDTPDDDSIYERL